MNERLDERSQDESTARGNCPRDRDYLIKVHINLTSLDRLRIGRRRRGPGRLSWRRARERPRPTVINNQQAMPAIEDYHSDELSIPPPPLLLFDSRLTPVLSLACSDDDTDLPLPSAPSPPPRAPPAAAPAAGANAANPMAGLQAMMEAMGAGGMMDDPRFAEGAGGGKREKGVEYVEDDGPYKECVSLLLPTLFPLLSRGAGASSLSTTWADVLPSFPPGSQLAPHLPHLPGRQTRLRDLRRSSDPAREGSLVAFGWGSRQGTQGFEVACFCRGALSPPLPLTSYALAFLDLHLTVLTEPALHCSETGAQDAPQRLGEPRTGQDRIPQGRSAYQPFHHQPFVLPLPSLSSPSSCFSSNTS